MKKGFILILSILFLCSCTSNTSKQTSDSITYNSTSSVSESINSSIEESSSQSSKSSASSTSVEQEFSTAKMDDLTVDYDGKPHTITPTGYPEGTRITYSSASEFTDVGTHTVSVLLSKNGYKNKLLTATLTIRPIDMSGVVFEDETFMYDGNPHSITVKNVPSGTIVSYKRLNGSGNNQFTEKGKYNIQATIENRNYNTLVLTATLTIKGYDEVYGVDSSKQPYQFPKTCFWDTVFPEFLKGNYTALICSGSRSSKDEEINILEHNYTKVVSDGKEFYKEYHASSYVEYEYYMNYGNDTVCYDATVSESETRISKTKMPAVALKETTILSIPAQAFNGLQKADNGMIIPGVDLDDFYGNEGTYEIKDNHFVVTLEHGRDNNTVFFYTVVDFYNIGNTTLDLPHSLVSDEDIKNMGICSNFYIGGIQYRYALVSTWNSPTEYMAHTYLYYWQQLIVEPGVHFVYPAIYGVKVQRVVYTFYSETNVYNYNMTGYEINVCFDESGNYQGEYEEYGAVTDRTSEFVRHGGVVHYYNDWAIA